MSAYLWISAKAWTSKIPISLSQVTWLKGDHFYANQARWVQRVYGFVPKILIILREILHAYLIMPHYERIRFVTTLITNDRRYAPWQVIQSVFYRWAVKVKIYMVNISHEEHRRLQKKTRNRNNDYGSWSQFEKWDHLSEFFLSILFVELFHELFQIRILIRYRQREFHSTWRYDFWTSEAFVGSYHVTHMHSTTYDRTYDQVTSKFSGLNLGQFKKNCSFWIEKSMKSLNWYISTFLCIC